jgi:hypothetical protein
MDMIQIFPFSDFVSSSKFREQIKDSEMPYILTLSGRAAFVVQSIESYQRNMTMVEYGHSQMLLEKARNGQK